jgi:hypothetical protein
LLPERLSLQVVELPCHRPFLKVVYLLVRGFLVEGEVEVEDGLLEVLGEIYFLPVWVEDYLY